MKLPTVSPLLRMTSALVMLCGMVLVLADVVFGLFPDREQQRLDQRRAHAEVIVAQSVDLLRLGQADVLERSLRQTVARHPNGLQGLALRRADNGQWLAAIGAPVDRPDDLAVALPDRLSVPLMAGGQLWGHLVLQYESDTQPLWQRWLTQPLVLTLLALGALGSVAIGLYMRRALAHLDPSSVIPARVQNAFNAMTEGVVVLDARGRVLLFNHAFAHLSPEAGGIEIGAPLASARWLANALGANATRPPWLQAISQGHASPELELAWRDLDDGAMRQVVVNAAPVLDAGGKPRGCLVTFSDVSELHRANAALRGAMDELRRSQQEIQRQNEELTRLATRDPLTGCLNRRAFTETFAPLFERASRGDERLSCLILDIDHFKKINDTHGHGVGDVAIQAVARILQESARPQDLVCRWGGEEFVVALPGIDAMAAAAIADTLRRRIERDAGLAVKEVPGLRITASVGVAEHQTTLAHAHQLVELADGALYEAKRSGRNRVTVAPRRQAVTS